MIRTQKHERLMLKALRAEGFTVTMTKGASGHSGIEVSKDGVTHKFKLASSPSDAEATHRITLAKIKRRFK